MITTRLWHIDLIEYLPKSQLIAQWRELNSIFKKQDNHILINYVYYNYNALRNYTEKVIKEFAKRKIKIRSFVNEINFFARVGINIHDIHNAKFKEHDYDYLTICYYNLKEKYLRGQKDFTKDVWDKLDRFYQRKMFEIALKTRIRSLKKCFG